MRIRYVRGESRHSRGCLESRHRSMGREQLSMVLLGYLDTGISVVRINDRAKIPVASAVVIGRAIEMTAQGLHAR